MKRTDTITTVLCTAGAAVLGMALSLASAHAEVKDDARKAGRAVGSTVHDIGQGAKKVGKEIGQGAKKVGKTVGTAAKDGVEALKEGGREFKQAVKGE